MLFTKRREIRKKLLLFIGSPRTGSTLLGQIINYHPSCLVANEFRLLNKIIIDKKKVGINLRKLEKYALNQFKKGLENDKKYGKTLNQYQKKWVGFQRFANEKEFQKQEIDLIGDKKAGGNIKVIMNFQADAKKLFQKMEQLYFLQIIRNPIDAALSLMKSHKVDKFEEAIEQIVYQTMDAASFALKNNYNFHYLYYEDLVRQPEFELGKIFDFLNLEYSITWISQISQVISKAETKEINLEYIDIFYKTLEKYEDSNILNRYKS